MPKTSAKSSAKTRIQSQNEAVILDAALEMFSAYGFRGTTVDQIAVKCGLSKPNLLYYFCTKDAIYKAVLERTLTLWLEPLQSLDPTAEPLGELARYISAKVDASFAKPEASKLFANEILHGAPHIATFLKGPLKQLVDTKAAVIRRWMAEGRLAPMDPHHLIFSIWAVTQHYADFGVQVEAVLGRKPDISEVKPIVLDLLLRGLKPKA